jgi:hypothetical protein
MTTQLQSQSIETMPVIFWQNQPVITTERLASVYEVDVRNIQMNFKNNERRFSAGVHYYKLIGDELKQFILQPKDIGLQISPMTRSLMLWTERGTVRHAKMIGTDKAWEVQDRLEQFYFSRRDAEKDAEKPAQLTYATKEQREPLVHAVRRLVKVAESKGRSLSYSDAHSIINLKMGVVDVEHLTTEQIPQAMTLVGELLERVVLEGEYIAKGEPEPKPEAPPEYLTYNDMNNLRNIIWVAAGKGYVNGSMGHLAWHRIRQATGVKAPGQFRVSDIPVIAHEMAIIAKTANSLNRFIRESIMEAGRRILKNNEDAETVLAEISERRKSIKEIDLYRFEREEIQAFVDRKPYQGRTGQHDDHAEGAFLRT